MRTFKSQFRGETEGMNQIIEINRRGVFSLEEAECILPVIYRITKTYSEKVDELIERLESMTTLNEELSIALEDEANQMIEDWQAKVQKLGAEPKGLWLVDFDSGDGYFCWKYPEPRIEYWHKYTDGFSKRVHVSEKRTNTSLQELLQKKISNVSAMALRPTELTD